MTRSSGYFGEERLFSPSTHTAVRTGPLFSKQFCEPGTSTKTKLWKRGRGKGGQGKTWLHYHPPPLEFLFNSLPVRRERDNLNN